MIGMVLYSRKTFKLIIKLAVTVTPKYTKIDILSNFFNKDCFVTVILIYLDRINAMYDMQEKVLIELYKYLKIIKCKDFTNLVSNNEEQNRFRIAQMLKRLKNVNEIYVIFE